MQALVTLEPFMGLIASCSNFMAQSIMQYSKGYLKNKIRYVLVLIFFITPNDPS